MIMMIMLKIPYFSVMMRSFQFHLFLLESIQIIMVSNSKSHGCGGTQCRNPYVTYHLYYNFVIPCLIIKLLDNCYIMNY
jgi:hypothetical protein